jgi:hypothetical protein
METAALIAALLFGAIGCTSLVVISLYTTRRVARDAARSLPNQYRRRLTGFYLATAAFALGAFMVGATAGFAGFAIAAVVPAVVGTVLLLVDWGRAATRALRGRRGRP